MQAGSEPALFTGESLMIQSSIQPKDLAKLLYIFAYPVGVNEGQLEWDIPEWLFDLLVSRNFF